MTLFPHRKSLPNVKELEPGVEEAAEQVLKLREYQDVNERIRSSKQEYKLIKIEI